MSENMEFSVVDVLRDAESAFEEGRSRLLSQTLYQFFPDDNKLIIQDFDVIVLYDQCPRNISKLTLKSIRKTGTPKGSFFECNDVAAIEAAIRGRATKNVKKLDISENQSGLMDVCIKAPNLRVGKIYVVRVDYDVSLNRAGSSQLMFSGAIQPSDYHGFCRSIGLPLDAKKTMEVIVSSQYHFTAWFNDPRKNEYFPQVVKPKFDAQKGYLARHPFHHEITGDDLRARYFSVFVDLSSQENVFPSDGDFDMLGDAPMGIGA